MAKGKPPEKSAPAGASNPALAKLRGQIDKLDQELVKRMNERAKLALEIGKLKEATGQVCYDPAREEEILSKVVEHSKGPLGSQALKSVFRELISGSRALEKELRVAYLGPAYSYS